MVGCLRLTCSEHLSHWVSNPFLVIQDVSGEDHFLNTKHQNLHSDDVSERVVAGAAVASRPCLYERPGLGSVKHKPPGSTGISLNLATR